MVPMPSLQDTLTTHPLVYVTRDIERALGLPLTTAGYVIISNSSPFARELQAQHSDEGRTQIVLVDEKEPLSTRALLEHSTAVETINGLDQPYVLVFKNNGAIEMICKKHGWKLLNPSATLSNTVEQKISQIDWLGDLASYLPSYEVFFCKDIQWQGMPFILQFNTGHSGGSTKFIQSAEELSELQQLFPKRQARISKHITGPIVTSNNVVTPETTLVGNISYQITGLAPFTDHAFATIGNDWKLPSTLMSMKQHETYVAMVEAIGNKLRTDGWKGLFGVDVVIEESTGELFLLEINARQPASATFESTLQQSKADETHMTTFEAHVMTLLDIDISDRSLAQIEDGAQVIQRVTKYRRKVDPHLMEMFRDKGITVLPTNLNTKHGTEIWRVQSEQSMMKAHNELNGIAKQLL